jgi:pimeloyl-ACP methyl ester carboxylesterase
MGLLSVDMLKRILVALAVVVAAVIALFVFAWFRPMTVFNGLRSMQLAKNGVKSGYVPVGTHRLHYLTGGEGPPLVIVHGVASKGADHADLFPELMRSRRIYAIDLLGYGKSDKPRDAAYSIRMHADVIEGFLDAMQIKKADVMGVSMGGWIALDLAARRPDRVGKLVLVSSAGLGYETTLNESSFAPENVEQLRDIIAMQTNTQVPDFVLRDLLRLSKERGWMIKRTMKGAAGELLDGKLASVTMPALLVWGTADRIVPLPVGERLQRELPNSKMVKVDGCGHLAVIECRDRVLPPIVEFLR